MAKNTAKGDEIVLLKKYIAFHFDQHQKKDPETMCVVILDMSNASVTNIVSNDSEKEITIKYVYIVRVSAQYH